MTYAHFSKPFATATGLLLCSIPALAQSAQDSRAKQSAPDGPGVTIAGGEVQMIPILSQDNSPRLPVGPVSEAHDEGDVMLEPASGDPHFLGFAAGAYYPPKDERLDPDLLAEFSSEMQDGRPSQETYAFVMVQGRITNDLVDLITSKGVRVIGDHPSNCLKVALTLEGALNLSELAEVRWVGMPQKWQKIHPVLQRELDAKIDSANAEDVEIYVSVYDSDLNDQSEHESLGSAQLVGPDGVQDAPEGHLPTRTRSRGWQESNLREAGAQDPVYIDRARVFKLTIHPSGIPNLRDLDFVAFVELAERAQSMHEESMAMVNADRGRASYDGGTNGVAVIGEVDWGINASHAGLNHAYGWGWNLGPGTQGAWSDGCGHGSHVAGTIFGNGSVEDSWQGAAPGIGGQPWLRYYNVKIGGDVCGTVNVDMAAVLSRLEGTVFDGTYNSQRPHVINHSWGSSNIGPYFGTETHARLLDTSSYNYRQLHVLAAGNSGSGGQTLSLQASAKNVLSVGNVVTYQSSSAGSPGSVWGSSSRGPTGDFRWGPKVCAPGVSIRSVNAGTGAATGYTLKTGTSMAAPHVTGIAAQLVDRHSFLRYNPATLSAVMMAGAITKDGEQHTFPSISSTHHLNVYGAGRVDAYKAAGGNGQQSMYFWGYDQGSANYGQLDFAISSGATRVTVVMNYQELEGSAGASSPLRNDLDMWIDRAPFTSGGNTGEYFNQQSGRDTTEIRTIDNPMATNYRIKIYPESTASGSNGVSHVGVCVIVTYGDLTPDLNFGLAADDIYVQPGDPVDITASVYNPSYIASAVYLSTGGLGTLDDARTVLEDGSTASLANNNFGGTRVLAGNIRHGKTRAVTWDTHWDTEGTKVVSVVSSSDNAGVDSDIVTVYVDGQGPSGPAGFASSSHSVGYSCTNLLQLNWTAAADFISGVAGYRVLVDHNSSTTLTGSLNYGSSATGANINVPNSSVNWYAHIRAQDRSGNWGATQHVGPFLINPSAPYNYCTGAGNSTGLSGFISWSGSTSVGANDLLLRADNLPATVPNIFFYGPNEIQLPFGNGFRCVGGQIFRMPVQLTSNGSVTQLLDYNSLPVGGDINLGDTWKFQNWYRDNAAGGAGFNLSNGLSVTFCP